MSVTPADWLNEARRHADLANDAHISIRYAEQIDKWATELAEKHYRS